MTIPAGNPDPALVVVDLNDLETAISATAQRIHTALSGQHDGTAVSRRTEEGARMVWESIWGHLRGRIPLPVPPDLQGVAVAAGTRICQGMANAGTLTINPNAQSQGVVEFRPWSGWLIPEKVTLNRYRQRTA